MLEEVPFLVLQVKRENGDVYDSYLAEMVRIYLVVFNCDLEELLENVYESN